MSRILVKTEDTLLYRGNLNNFKKKHNASVHFMSDEYVPQPGLFDDKILISYDDPNLKKKELDKKISKTRDWKNFIFITSRDNINEKEFDHVKNIRTPKNIDEWLDFVHNSMNYGITEDNIKKIINNNYEWKTKISMITSVEGHGRIDVNPILFMSEEDTMLTVMNYIIDNDKKKLKSAHSNMKQSQYYGVNRGLVTFFTKVIKGEYGGNISGYHRKTLKKITDVDKMNKIMLEASQSPYFNSHTTLALWFDMASCFSRR